jgi:hypothetical protein
LIDLPNAKIWHKNFMETSCIKIIFLIKEMPFLSLVVSVTALVFKLMTQHLTDFHGAERVSLAVTLLTFILR